MKARMTLRRERSVASPRSHSSSEYRKALSSQGVKYLEQIKELPSPYCSLPWKLGGFRRQVFRLACPKFTAEMYEEWLADAKANGEWISPTEAKRQYRECVNDETKLGIIPDANCFVDGILYALEIVETNDIDEEKFWSYDQAHCCVADEGYQFVLLIYYPRQRVTLLCDDFDRLPFVAREVCGSDPTVTVDNVGLKILHRLCKPIHYVQAAVS